MKISKLAQKILTDGYRNIGANQTRLVKAVKELQGLNLVDVEICKNDYGYTWFIVRNKSQFAEAEELVRKIFNNEV